MPGFHAIVVPDWNGFLQIEQVPGNRAFIGYLRSQVLPARRADRELVMAIASPEALDGVHVLPKFLVVHAANRDGPGPPLCFSGGDAFLGVLPGNPGGEGPAALRCHGESHCLSSKT